MIRTKNFRTSINGDQPETIKVSFTIKPSQLAKVNSNYKMVVNEGELVVSIGGAQPSENRLKSGNTISKKIQLVGEPFLIVN